MALGSIYSQYDQTMKYSQLSKEGKLNEKPHEENSDHHVV